MIRNLKVMFAAALALTALGAIAASAHAADEFHCSVEPCRMRVNPDGNVTTEGKTAHQVFILENLAKTKSASFTCEKLTGEGTAATKTVKAVTLTNIKYVNCTVAGSTGVTVDMNGCNYNFSATNGTTDAATVQVECGATPIEITAPNCIVKIGSQTLTGVGYHPIGTTPNREVTVTAPITTSIKSTSSGTGCTALGIPLTSEGEVIGTYTTGNAIVTGETATTEAMADAWYE